MVWTLIIVLVLCILAREAIAASVVEAPVHVTAHQEPREVQLIVVTDWTPKRIEEEIRKTFPEAPELAVAVAKCESGLKPQAKGPTSDYGVFQVHAPSWDKKARQLGYEDYKTDVKDNLAMARYIYDNAGGTFKDWVCYTRKMY